MTLNTEQVTLTATTYVFNADTDLSEYAPDELRLDLQDDFHEQGIRASVGKVLVSSIDEHGETEFGYVPYLQLRGPRCPDCGEPSEPSELYAGEKLIILGYGNFLIQKD